MYSLPLQKTRAERPSWPVRPLSQGCRGYFCAGKSQRAKTAKAAGKRLAFNGLFSGWLSNYGITRSASHVDDRTDRRIESKAGKPAS